MFKKKSNVFKLGVLVFVVMFVCANILGFLGVSPTSPRVAQAASDGLPAHLLTGYWHNFDNGSTPLRLIDCPTSYTIVAVAFAEATSPIGAVDFQLDSKLAGMLNNYTEADFISDIKKMQARGQKVIISVGGERANVSIASSSAANNFANSIYDLMQKYGFDGVDIDLEHGINSTYLTQALKQLSGRVGSRLIITMAPQTIDMQSTGTEYFKLALNIKDILTVCNMQYYNSGTMLGHDGQVYAQGTVDFLTALATIQLEGGLRPDQVGLGLPAQTRAAGGGYVSPSVVNDALDSLAYGTKAGKFTPPNKYPTIRGAMTWSINWDAHNGYNWSKTIYPHLKTLPCGVATPPPTPTPTPTGMPSILVEGYVDGDFNYSDAAAGAVKSGFKVEITGVATRTTTTDSNGFYQFKDLPLAPKSQPYKMVISKPNYLTREITVGSNNKSLRIGTESAPVKMWAGDMLMSGVQDGAINMSDIMQMIQYFNSSKGDNKYNTAADFNQDNAINMTDIMIVVRHFNTTAANYPTDDYEVVDLGSVVVPTPTPTIEPTPTPSNGVPEWSPNNVAYKVGDKVTYQGATYECTYAHNSNTAWTPSATFTLWKKL